MRWNVITTPEDALPPSPITTRAQTIPPRHCFADHAHDWNQVVYAISGVLTVVADGHSFVISPHQAAWLPTGAVHKVGSFLGAEFRSLWIAEDPGAGIAMRTATVLSVSPLLRALIIELTALSRERDDDGYSGRVCRLIMDQLSRAQPVAAALPWPQSPALSTVCEALYENPADPRSVEAWAGGLGMSGRTFTRRFFAETGTTLRSWRRRHRIFRALELLESGMDVTATALELGYGSTSAFIYAFRLEMKSSPQAYVRAHRG